MFCPQCKCEYREGFTHCADCNVQLVADPSAASSAESRRQSRAAPPAGTRLLDYCGFFTLEEAREARARLRAHRIRSEIAIREVEGSSAEGPLAEEYWLRFALTDLAAAQRVLGYDEAGDDEAETYVGAESVCPGCGRTLPAAESFCPHCGARVEQGG